MRIDNIDVWGFEHAVRGMRNPLDSWDRSDSDGDSIGEADLELMKKLCKAGTEHRKFMRQIIVVMDITAPLYWWKEFDTYKVGTVANSCSTMHTLHKRDLTLDDFEHDQGAPSMHERAMEFTLEYLNALRKEYVDTGDKACWRSLVQLLPSSFLQRRTVTMNYETVLAMMRQRKGHKLTEWDDLLKIFENLPYIANLLC